MRAASTALAAAAALGGVVWSALLLWAPTTVDLAAERTAFSGDAEVVTVPEYGPRGTDIVGYRDGAELVVTVPVRNDGRLTVTLTSAATGAGLLPLLEVRSVGGLPLQLSPGKSGELVLRAVLTNCAYHHEREMLSVRDLVVGVEIGIGPLGRSAQHVVALDRPLLVPSPMIVRCPDRALTRDDDRRDPSSRRL